MQRTPSRALAFHRDGVGNVRPQILFTTGSVGVAILLTPTGGGDINNWQYHYHELFEDSGGIGLPTVVDADGDGLPELIIPRRNEGILEVLSFGDVAGSANKCGLCWDCINNNGRCPCCCTGSEGCRRCGGMPHAGMAKLEKACRGSCGLCRGKDFLRGEGCVCGIPQVSA